jgi:heme o synthase
MSLTKPRLAMLNIIAAASGIMMTRMATFHSDHLETVFYIALLIAGAGALNCVWEFEGDKKMKRTRSRAIPSGRISVLSGAIFGIFLVLAGLFGLYFRVNLLTFNLGVLSVVSYLLIYTPLKRRTHLAVYAGAVPGALPPVLGYTSVVNELDPMALTLFAILFFWQIPHFLAISIYQSNDYKKGGILVYPNLTNMAVTQKVMIFFSILTCLSGALPFVLGYSGLIFLISGLLLGLYFIYMNSTKIMQFIDDKKNLDKWAKKCFFASIVYLPLLFVLMIVF